METHYHFVIFAAEIKTEHGFAESTTIDVVALDKDEALMKARKLIPDRRHYWISSVVEHHAHGAA